MNVLLLDMAIMLENVFSTKQINIAFDDKIFVLYLLIV
jgi:hypothetical protein